MRAGLRAVTMVIDDGDGRASPHPALPPATPLSNGMFYCVEGHRRLQKQAELCM